MKKSILVLFLVLSLVTLISCRPNETVNKGNSPDGGSENPILVKIGHTDSSSRSTHKACLWLADYLEEKAPGRFKIEVYSDGQLGDTPDMIAGVKLGTMQICFDLSSVLTAAAGEQSTLIDLPYLYPTYEDWIEGTFEKGGLEVFNQMLEPSGYYCIDMFYNGMRQVISSKGNYHNSDDLKGQKVRIAQNELNVDLWKAMGANPTPMAWGEVITSLSQGQIDALDHSLGVFNDFQLYQMAPYVTLTNHASSPFPIVCSKEWFDSIPKEDKEVFVEGVKIMCENQRKEERANEEEYIKTFKAEGATVEELTDEEVAAFREAVQPVYDKMRKKVGDEVMEKWLSTVPE